MSDATEPRSLPRTPRLVVNRGRIIPALLAIYVFLLPLGNLARFSEEEGAMGFSTLLLLLVVLLGLSAIVTPVLRHPVFFNVGALVVWLMAASVFALDPLGAFRSSASLVLYLMFSVIAYRFIRTPDQMVFLILAYCLGGLVSAGLTLVDYAGLIDVPRVNEIVASTKTDVGAVMQVSGTFPRRSAMGEYFGLLIAMAVILAITARNLKPLAQMLAFATAAGCTLTLLLTHNRSGIFAPLLATLAVTVLISRSPGRFIRSILIVAAFSGLIALALVYWFPDVWTAYRAILGLGDTAFAAEVSESDGLRLVFFQHAVYSLIDAPFGHGYSLLHGVLGYDEVDPHNAFTQILWGGGLIGIAWMAGFAWQMSQRTWPLFSRRGDLSPFRSAGITLFGGLLAFLFIGMTHTTLSNGVAWLYFGLFIAALDQLPKAAKR